MKNASLPLPKAGRKNGVQGFPVTLSWCQGCGHQGIASDLGVEVGQPEPMAHLVHHHGQQVHVACGRAARSCQTPGEFLVLKWRR